MSSIIIEKSFIESISRVHMRSDMEVEELYYLTRRYNAQLFNLHPVCEYQANENRKKYFSKIYIENTCTVPTDEKLFQFADLCVDFSHWKVGGSWEIKSIAEIWKIKLKNTR